MSGHARCAGLEPCLKLFELLIAGEGPCSAHSVRSPGAVSLV